MEYNGKNPNGINQLSQSLLSIDVNGTEEVRIHLDKVIINNRLDVTESIYSPQITGSSITGSKISANQITGSNISADVFTANTFE